MCFILKKWADLSRKTLKSGILEAANQAGWAVLCLVCLRKFLPAPAGFSYSEKNQEGGGRARCVTHLHIFRAYIIKNKLNLESFISSNWDTDCTDRIKKEK